MTIRTWFAGAGVLLVVASGISLRAAPLSASSESQQAPGGAPPFGVVAYPPRPAGDPAAIERGKAVYGVNCTFCHGADARGGDGGGPNLLRSAAVLDDQRGELLAPIIQQGRGSMPKFALSDPQVGDIADFLHNFPVTSRSGPSTINILVGDAKAGAAYVAAKCSSCHTAAVLKAFAAKLEDPKTLQQMWLMPGGGGRGGRGAAPPIPSPPLTVTVTLASGETVSGRLDHTDDFVVSLVQADGRRRTFRTAGTTTKVAIHDPLKPHKDLLRTYTDADIHNVTAYLASLR